MASTHRKAAVSPGGQALGVYFHLRTNMTPQNVVQLVAAILLVVLIAIIILRRKSKKKQAHEEEF